MPRTDEAKAWESLSLCRASGGADCYVVRGVTTWERMDARGSSQAGESS